MTPFGVGYQVAAGTMLAGAIPTTVAGDSTVRPSRVRAVNGEITA